MEGSVLVIGGGIAGIQTSLDLTELGFKVYLIEKEPSIGGRMAQFDKLFPANDCSLCVLAPKMVAVYRNPDIELLTLSEVQGVTGEVGDFTVKILKEPRYVDEALCKGCGDCSAKCPKIEVPNVFDMNLGKRKSAYIPFPQATPPIYLLDPELCLYLKRQVCGVCKKVCQAEAIDFEQESRQIELNVGAIVVSTGFEMLGEDLSSKWGYQFKNVVNALEYERIISSSGPFGGHILRPSDEQEPKKIAFISCIMSEEAAPYCSRVCCMYTTKNAVNTKISSENSEIIVFRHNIRVFGKNFYEYTKNAQEDYKIEFIHSLIDKIEEDQETNDLIIHYDDLKSGESKNFRANLVVLSAPLVPSNGTIDLAKILGIELGNFNFFKERSYFNNSLSSRDGIFLSGLCKGPMNISETVVNSSGVAGQIAALLSSSKYTQIKEREIDILSKENIIDITPSALIIGGGVSGMTTALNISRQGFKTYIIEKENKLGGLLNNIYQLYPTQQKASEFLNNIIKEVDDCKTIQVLLNSQVREINGSIGNYLIKTGDNNGNLHSLNIGVIIVATGSQEFKPKRSFQYNEENQNVITLLELEQKLKNEDRSWLDKINHITTILCVHARQMDGFSYCSNVCCNNALKNINLLKEIKPELKILVFFRDLHTVKTEFEDIFNERNTIANCLRYNLNNIPEITKINNVPEKYSIKVRDELNNKIDQETDLIVLATPLIPSPNLEELAEMLDVPLDKNGFFPEAHEKLRPLDFVTNGVFICGCAEFPKNIQDSITQAKGAAGRASRFLSRKKISTTKLEYLSSLLSIECFFKELIVNPEKCNGCERCLEACAFNAIDIVDTQREYEDINLPIKKAVINSALCKGCGKCSSVCRLKAIEARHYDFKQISKIIDPYFLERIKGVEPREKREEIETSVTIN
ncbi:hypothetical protein LCGC14_0494550 [marine sediment metagenome]|uniref:4Fe-4S ferredoxin-type domain-containing protein n=1 Tax=marine sediment metagenome TaxID=412755 RepID=A0A0F9USL7_9ZZZZ